MILLIFLFSFFLVLKGGRVHQNTTAIIIIIYYFISLSKGLLHTTDHLVLIFSFAPQNNAPLLWHSTPCQTTSLINLPLEASYMMDQDTQGQEQELVSVHFITDQMPVTPAPVSYSVATDYCLSCICYCRYLQCSPPYPEHAIKV